ncbi:putative disease resistance protein RGA4 [Camellia sinensis]|uniref:putative disease resistance protein RGA4 n=1 Tax=Camellia sinensis TaxID=4442 RepID=UPI00103648D6|nr:putative disease resistance protein RGA4 [Camellia sinensis]
MAVPFLPFVLQNLNTLIQNEVGLLSGVNKEMKKLSSTLSTIQDVLEDAEQKQLQDKHIQNWLKELNDAAYEADDILDECATEALQCESKGQGYGSLKKVRTSLLTCYPLQNILFRHKIGNRIKEVTEKFDEIAAKRKFHLNVGDVGTRVLYDESRETSSLITQPELYGRGEEKEEIVTVLVENVRDIDAVSVYPILGIGGLGKTTLAQMVFNDDRVKGHFEPKIWVYVSQDFNLKRVIKETIKSASGEVSQDLDLGSLQRTLQDKLNGRRYLIVFDDVWDEDQEKWDGLKYLLACGSKGASVIVTTRVDKVASIMGTISAPRLSFLSQENCWLLFRQRAFGRGNEEHPNLVAIGKEIVKKCGGVPLAAKALGGLMRFKSQEKEWLHVKESEVWNLPEDKNSVLPALRLSYFYLPLESRKCFAYCAIFPKGSEIRKRDLIHLWMANGYISCKGGWEPEDIGDQIWNELCLISFFQVVKNYKANICFEMHDLVHDLAQSIMKDECEMIEFNSSSNISNEKVRHVTLVVGPGENFNKTFRKVESLRTLRLQCPRTFSLEDDEFLCDLRKFGSLRAFDAAARGMKELPSSIGNLKHLRYLNLYYGLINQLPDSICSLLNLQTLILDYCEDLERLPQNMMYLRSLRHLYLLNCPLIEMPPKIGQLTNLKTLTEFVVGKSTDCSLLAELKCLNLGGQLCIKHLERVSYPLDGKEAILVGKQNLSQLQLIWEYGLAECESQENVESEAQENVKSELVLEALQPHPNLKELGITGYEGTRFPLWMRGSCLQNVVKIELSRCNCLQLPPLGQLPLLQSLRIHEMDKVVECIENEYPCGRGFPSLEELDVYNCPKLDGLSRDEGRELFPRLRMIAIGYCPKLSFPHLSSPKELFLRGKCTMVLNSISNLNSLTSLAIVDDKETVCFPKEFLRNLTLLESLLISDWRELKVLPEELASLVRLKSLTIEKCRKLESLPEEVLGGLESLQSLCIYRCTKITSLPASIQSLTKLQRIQINFCSRELERRCEKGKGKDWYKIAHIPEVSIDKAWFP